MRKIDLLGKTEMEWYNLYKSFIDSVPMGYINEDGNVHVLSYNNCKCLYKCVKGEDGKFVVFDKPSISVCKEIVYNSSLEKNVFEFCDRVNNMSYEKRLKMIDKHNKSRGDYKWRLCLDYGKFLKAFRSGILGKRIERLDNYSRNSPFWVETNVPELIENGPWTDFRVVG